MTQVQEYNIDATLKRTCISFLHKIYCRRSPCRVFFVFVLLVLYKILMIIGSYWILELL